MPTYPFCAEEIQQGATVCPHCGSSLAASPVVASGDASASVFQQTWFIVLVLFTITPWGIVLMWLQKRRDGFLGGLITRVIITIGFGLGWSKLMLKLLG